MKLALTHPYSWPEVRRGAERIIVETARTIAGRGHHVTILTAGTNAQHTSDGNVTTIKLKRRLAHAGWHERLFSYQIVPYLIRGNFDAVHSMMARDALSAVRTRPITGHRAVYEELGSPFRWWWKGIPDGRVRAHLVKTVDVYGCMSNYSLDVLRDEWGRHGSLIPGGVRLSQFLPAESRAPTPTILFSGAIDERRKGLGDLLAAADLLVDHHPDLVIQLSGPGDPSEILSEAPQRVRDRVERLPIGAPTDQGARYASAWVTALPSVGDSFGMVLIESLASGTPIVVADDGAPPQLVTPQTGRIAKLHDPVDLARALSSGFALAENPATTAACRAYAAQFDWDTSLGPILENLYFGHV